jgi:hypothetical protein
MAGNNAGLSRLIARKAAEARQREKKRKEEERRRRLRAIAAVLCTFAAYSVSLALDCPDPIPKHTSLLTGQCWLDELLVGHPTRFREQFGMSKNAFYRLSFELQTNSGLVASKFVTADEKIATFLHFVRTGASNRTLQERFQRSGETINRWLFFMLSGHYSFSTGPYTRSYCCLWVHSTRSTSIFLPMRHQPRLKKTPNFTHIFAIVVAP